MNYYHLSYDLVNVESGDNEAALISLVRLVSEKFGGEILNRPVRSTVIFSGVLDFDAVRQEMFSWSKEVSAYYVISEVRISLPEGTHCRMVANKELEEGLEAQKKTYLSAEFQ